MAERIEVFPKNVEWQVTTTTIWCPEVRRRVTLIVRDDWTSYCCWYREHVENIGTETGKCKEKECVRPYDYRDRLIREENDEGRSLIGKM